MCRCGCSWERHHLCCVVNQEYIDATKEAYIPYECETYGNNEVGGMMRGEDGEWVVHCWRYVDSGEDRL